MNRKDTLIVIFGTLAFCMAMFLLIYISAKGEA